MKAVVAMKKGTSHQAQVKQLKRIAGQVRGVTEMIEAERYCVDILTQLKAIRASIHAVERKIVDSHLDHCVQTAISSKDSQESLEMVEEIRGLLRSMKP